MSSFSILILCLVFGLFVVSEAIGSRQGNALHQRRQRQVSTSSQPSIPLDTGVKGVEDVKKQVNSWLVQAAQSMENTTEGIKSALATINLAGLKNGSTVFEWVPIRNEIEKGLKLIINGYKTYLVLVQKILADIVKYVQGMINRYTSELSALYTMKPPAPVRPTGPNIYDQMSESDYNRLMAFLLYTRGSGQLFGFAFDSVFDFIKNLVAHHDAIVNRPVEIWQSVNVDFSSENDDQTGIGSTVIGCDDIWNNNGHQGCANDVAYASQTLAFGACTCVF